MFPYLSRVVFFLSVYFNRLRLFIVQISAFFYILCSSSQCLSFYYHSHLLLCHSFKQASQSRRIPLSLLASVCSLSVIHAFFPPYGSNKFQLSLLFSFFLELSRYSHDLSMVFFTLVSWTRYVLPQVCSSLYLIRI